MNVSAVLAELKAERGRLDTAIEALQSLTGAKGAGRTTKGKRTLSPAGRRRIAAAQRKRWAKWKRVQKRH
jgi:hypothetical protein